MSDPMEIETTEQNGVVVVELPDPPLPPNHKFLVSVEVCLKPCSTARHDDVRLVVKRKLEKRSLSYVDGPILVPVDDPFLVDNVERICICDTYEWVKNNNILLFWQVNPLVHVFQVTCFANDVCPAFSFARLA